MNLRFFTVLPLSASFLLTACALPPGEDPGDEGVGDAEQQERWAASDDPSIFSANLEKRAANLPDQGEASPIPWPGNYWPTASDNINYRWDGSASMSPAKKYEKSFGLAGVEDQVSKYHGIDSQTNAKVCTQNTECDASLGEVCAKRTGASSGRCIATWFGICHAWSPAAILVPEPQRAVVRNGVTFKIQDIKALVSLVHDQTDTKFLSLRCDQNDAKGEITYDQYGRAISACRDTNAGTFHVVLTNYLGIQKKSFVEDRTFDYEVWNQPLRGYKVVEKKTVTGQEANRLVGVKPTGGTTQTGSGTLAAGAWTYLAAIPVTAGSSYSVTMTGTGDADLYVQFGSKPTTNSYVCRPYLDGTNEECSGVAPAGATMMYVGINGYAASSNYSVTAMGGGTIPSTYVFNADAKSLVYVKNDVSYITESSASTDGNLASSIDQYTAHDVYEYVLELDGNGVVIGGEWVGSSKRSHPDFLWLPLGVSSPSVAGGAIEHSAVRIIAQASVAPVGTSLKTSTYTGTVASGAFKYYGPFKTTAGTNLRAQLTGTGDADLYVRKGAQPTTSVYDCRPYQDTTNETCDVAASGDVYVAVQGYAASSNYTLTVDYVGP